MEDVEGTCTGQFYIICVMDTDTQDFSEGRVVPGSAVAEYTVHYRAVVWRPFKGETVCLPLEKPGIFRADCVLICHLTLGRCYSQLCEQRRYIR